MTFNFQDDLPSPQSSVSGELSRKRPVPLDNEQMTNGHETISKRIRSGPDSHSTLPAKINDSGQDLNSVNGVSPNVPLLDSEMTAVEQMIAVIGALLAEGERGAESLEILISKIHPDLLADIVITNMKHLPKTPPPLARIGNLPVTRQLSSQVSQSQGIATSVPINSVQSLSGTGQALLPSTTAAVIGPSSLPIDTSNFSNLPADSKRDPRRVNLFFFFLYKLAFGILYFHIDIFLNTTCVTLNHLVQIFRIPVASIPGVLW